MEAAAAAPRLYCFGCSKALKAAKRCTRCKLAAYCGADCQRRHWSAPLYPHKMWCYPDARFGENVLPEDALPETDTALKACGDRMREAFRHCPDPSANALFATYVMLCYSALCDMRYGEAPADHILGEFVLFFEAAMRPFVVDQPLVWLRKWLSEWDRRTKADTPDAYALRALTGVLQRHADASPEKQNQLAREALRAGPHRYTDEQLEAYIKSMKRYHHRS